MKESATAFKLLFSGSKNAYGIHVPSKGPIVEGEKAKGESYTKREPLDETLYDQHLDGITSLGVVPVFDDKLSFFAIDVDEYPSDPSRYCKLLLKNKLPLCICNSKSGGLHIYGFMVQPVKAADAISLVPGIKALLGVSAKTEVFPKQAKVSEGSTGNWINLPYFNAKATRRPMYDEAGNKLPFEEAMEFALSRRTTLSELASRVRNAPLSQAPPCLQSMFIQDKVEPSNRNIFLFNAATYLKLRFKNDYAEKLSILNESLPDPLTHQELMSTVVSSHEKGTYSYQCQESSLVEHCQKEECACRKFGKAQARVGDFTFERLVQVRSSTPYYKWIVNGVEMTFYSEAELRDQSKFCDYCMRYLRRMAPRMKANHWSDILNNALEHMEVEEVKKDEDISSIAIWYSYFRSFIADRNLAEAGVQVESGLVYYCEEDKGFYFRIEDLLHYMEVTKHYRESRIAEIHYKLRKIGVESRRVPVDEGSKPFTAWFCPESALDLDSTSLQIIADEEQEGLEMPSPERAVQKSKKMTRGRKVRALLDKLDEEGEEF